MRGDGLGRLTFEWWLVLVFAAAALGLAVASQATSRLDFWLYDTVQRHLRPAPDDDVLLVAIDDRAIAETQAWPWPRERLAELVEAVGRAGPKAVGMDILLLEPRGEAGDAALARALREAAPVYLPMLFTVPGRNGAAFDIAPPLPAFGTAAAGLGQVNFLPDSDGVIRRVYLRYDDGRRSWPSLAALVAGRGRPADAVAAGLGQLRGQEQVLIRFAGPSGSFPSVSAGAVLRGEVPPEFLRGRRILIGVTASGVGDVYATSGGIDGTLMPGVEIQANVVATLLGGRPAIPADGLATFAFAFLPLVALMIGLRVLRPRWTLPLILVLACAVLGASFLLLRHGAVWLPPGAALAAILLVYPAWTWRKLALASGYLTHELERSAQAAPGLLLERGEADPAPADELGRQMHLLSQAVQRERDLRRFFVDRLAQMPDYVVVTDLTGRIVFSNASAARLYADLNGGGMFEWADDLLGYLHRSSPSGRVPISFAAAARTHGIPWHCEAEAWNGGYFDVRFEPQRNSDDQLVGFVIRIVDKTDATMTQRQRDEALQLLSHDMCAPQSSIVLFLDSSAAAAIPPEVAERIQGYARRTLKLADDFVHFARAQTLDLGFEDIDIAGLAFEASDGLWPQAEAKGVRIVLDLPPDELLVAGNGSLLARMLANLVDNAVKFSRPGGEVRVACTPIEQAGARFVSVTVGDDGVGIAPDRMSLIYQRFQSSSPTGSHGVGLGLAFVHTVVVRHQGRIVCRSVEGEGTTFTVELPVPPQAPNTAR